MSRTLHGCEFQKWSTWPGIFKSGRLKRVGMSTKAHENLQGPYQVVVLVMELVTIF